MKLFVIVLAVLIVGGLFFADYKWREWMVTRRREHENEPGEHR